MSRRCLRRFVSCVAVVSLLAGLMQAVQDGASASSSGPTHASPVPAPAEPVVSRPDEVSARLAAAAQGSRVRVTSLDDETSSTYINADGTYSTETSTSPIRVRQDGKLVAVDYDLEHVDGGWSPKASPVPVTFSDGADNDAASIGSGQKTVALSWKVTLPKPTITADTASYDLGDGQALVLSAGPTGFEQSLVLDHAPTALPKIKLPLDTAGLDMSAADGGGYKFTNAAGDVVYEMPLPTMFGHSVDPVTEQPAQSSPVATSLTQTADGAELDLTPSLAWLQAADRSYPVTIDPSIRLSDNGDTYVSEGTTSSNNGANVLHAGWYSGHAARTYIQSTTGVSSLRGKHVVKVVLNLYNNSSMSCTARTINAYPLTADYTSSTVWTNRPAFTTSATYAGSGSFAHGFSSSCNNAWATVDVTKIVNGWANGGLANHGIQLSGTESSGNQGWGFCSQNNASSTTTGTACNSGDRVPYFTATYNTVPGTGASQQVAPSAAGTSPLLTNTTTPKLSGIVTDADGGSMNYNFQVATSTTATPLVTGSVAATAGTRATWTVPSGKLADKTTYYWRLYGNDGTDNGGVSPWQAFTVDTSAPTPPTVSSATWPANTWAAAKTGTISWSDGATDVASYSYSIDGGAWSAAKAGTSSSFTFANGPHSIAVKAIDKAGNISVASPPYSFGVGSAGVVAPAEGDVTQKNVTLSAEGPSTYSYVYYQWRQGTTNNWTTIPNTELVVPGSTSDHPNSQVVALQDATGKDSTYVWDATTHATDGTVQLQGCLSAAADGSASSCQALPTNIQLSSGSFGAAQTTQQLGAGELALLTGDYSVQGNDVSVPAYNGTLSVSRTATTLKPAAASTSATGVFGPGWTASLDGPDSGDASEIPTVAADKSYLVFTGPDGAEDDYLASTSLTGSTISYDGIADSDDGSVATLNGSSLYLTQPDGTKTTWKQVTDANGHTSWAPGSVVETGDSAAQTSSYFYNTSAPYTGLASRIVAPAPAGVDCSTDTLAATTKGCRSLAFNYTTVAGAARLSYISLVAWDPASNAMTSTQMATYDYSLDGTLADEYDKRISPALITAYVYDTDHRLTTVTPPGLAAWSLHYDEKHRISTITRPDAAGGIQTNTVVYNLPLSGSAGLPDLTLGTNSGSSPHGTSTWAQTSDLPVTGSATAIFDANHVPAGTTASSVTTSDWPYADVSYLDVNGRAVDTASYGAGDWQVGATTYDSYGNTVWSLTPGNRAQALITTASTDPAVVGTADSADRAGLLATVNTYNADGTELLDELGPMHPVTLPDGTVIDGRIHTVTTYDQGAPASDVNPATGGPYRLPTTVVRSVADAQGTDADGQTSTTGYDPIDGTSATSSTSGWTLGMPTVSTDAGGLITKTLYNSAGQVVEQRLPSETATSGTRTTKSTYYGTGSGTGCANTAFIGLLCIEAPAAQPNAASPLPVTSYNYDLYLQQISKVATYGSDPTQVTRTWTTTYDAAERPKTSSVTVSPTSAGGTAVPTVTTGYDPATGLVTSTSTASASLTTGYDSDGRKTSYTDADGIQSTISYDLANNVVSTNDGKHTTAYTIDGGSGEHRGLVTNEDIGVDGAPSSFTAVYDAAGQMTSETYPNGLAATTTYDNAEQVTELDYAKNGTDWLDYTQAHNAHDQIVTQASPQSAQTFGYDGSDRLTHVQDTLSDPNSDAVTCTTRSYTYDADSNRTSLTAYPDDGSDPDQGNCTTDTTAATASYSYDTGDRLNSDTAGSYAYDTLGRATTVPAGDAEGIGSHSTITGSATISYFANDMVNGEAQESAATSFTLDPMQNRIRTQGDGGTTTTSHYDGDGDSPSWTSAPGTWIEYDAQISGDLAAQVDQSGTVILQLTNPHGDVVAFVSDATNAASPTQVGSENTEFGAPRDAPSAFDTYGWLGSKQRSSNDLGGLLLMGVRLYSSSTGRFTSRDSISGGNANDYVYPLDPVDNFDLSGRCFEDACVIEVSGAILFVGALFGAISIAPLLHKLAHQMGISYRHLIHLMQNSAEDDNEHTKNARKSTEEKHQRGRARVKKDQRGTLQNGKRVQNPNKRRNEE